MASLLAVLGLKKAKLFLDYCVGADYCYRNVKRILLNTPTCINTYKQLK